MRKRITSKDIAKLAGVSRTTVSFVLNDAPGMRIPEETRQRVLAAARQLDYQPDEVARSMASGRRNLLGFVVRQSADQAFADHFLPQVLNGITRAADEQGYHTIFEPISPEDKRATYSQLIATRHVDGIVLSGPRSDDQELLRIHAAGAHIVMMGQVPNSDIPFVDVDNIGGARLATDHLISLGHHRIALITNAPPAYTASADRFTGYRQALEVAGPPFHPSLGQYGNSAPPARAGGPIHVFSPPLLPTDHLVPSRTLPLG